MCVLEQLIIKNGYYLFHKAAQYGWILFTNILFLMYFFCSTIIGKFKWFEGLNKAGPSLFRNKRQILKNTKENRYRICIGYNFFTISALNSIPWHVIYIFSILSIDTQLGPITGHIWSGHNGHYVHFLKIAGLPYSLINIIIAKWF